MMMMIRSLFSITIWLLRLLLLYHHGCHFTFALTGNNFVRVPLFELVKERTGTKNLTYKSALNSG